MTDTLLASVQPASLIFDLDGTLIDSAPDIAESVTAALAEHEIHVDADEVRRYIGDGAARLIERVLAARRLELDDAARDRAIDAFHAHYQAHPCRATRCYPGVAEMLAARREEGVRLAVCTNKPQAVAERVLAELALAERIDVLIGAGRYPLKPDPAPLQACLDALGTTAENTVYIGDMDVDRQAARAAGLRVVLTRFGYAHDDVARFEPDAVLDTWDDWPRVATTLPRG